MKWLDVLENKIVYEGETEAVPLRGVAIGDPKRGVEPHHYTSADFDELKRWGCKVIRLPLHLKNHTPPDFEMIRKYVKELNHRGMYVILDCHADRFNLSAMRKWWREVGLWSRRESGVLLEVMNEARDISWGTWKNNYQALVDEIRKVNERSLLLVGGLDWGYDLSALNNPAYRIQGERIVYCTHPYPKDRPYSEYDAKWGFLASDYPIFLTEFGYEGDSPDKVWYADHEWLRKLLGYCESKEIYWWTAWCWCPRWKPQLITDWNYTRTSCGDAILQYLLTRA